MEVHLAAQAVLQPLKLPWSEICTDIFQLLIDPILPGLLKGFCPAK
jgi:hypothetical protein